MTPRERLLERLGDLRDPDVPRPLVSLEEFFVGNDDPLSIATSGEPDARGITLQGLFGIMRELRAHPATYDVRVEVGPPRTPDGWPTTDTIWIVSRLARRDFSIECINTKAWWDTYLPLDWQTYPRMDGRKIEPLKLPVDAHAYGFYYM